MPASTLAAIREALPRVRFKQTYGLSELGILPTQSRDSGSLWLKLGNAGFEHKIVDGILWLKSDTAMLGYLNAPSPFDQDGWFNTQDLVEVDGDYVRILGRKSELINVGGEKVHPTEIENVLLQLDNVRDVTVCGKAQPGHRAGGRRDDHPDRARRSRLAQAARPRVLPRAPRALQGPGGHRRRPDRIIMAPASRKRARRSSNVDAADALLRKQRAARRRRAGEIRRDHFAGGRRQRRQPRPGSGARHRPPGTRLPRCDLQPVEERVRERDRAQAQAGGELSLGFGRMEKTTRACATS